MSIDARHLAHLLAVAQHGSFNRAARACGVSQPALSASISQLERRLGVRVLDRTRSGSELNEFGKILVRSAHTIEAIVAQIDEEVRLRQVGVEGPLRIGATPSLMLKFVPDVVTRLLQERPTRAVSLIEGLEDQLLPALKSGKLDVVFGPISDSKDKTTEFVEEPLFEDQFSIGVAPHHALSKRRSLTLSELQDTGWVLPGPGNALRQHYEAVFMAAGMAWPKNCVTTTSLPMIAAILHKTDHVTLITSLLRDAWRVRSIPLAGAGKRLIGIRRRKGEQPSVVATRAMQIAFELVKLG